MKYFNIYKLWGIFIVTIFFTSCVEYQNQPQNGQTGDKRALKMVLDLSGRWRFSLGDKAYWKDKNFNDNEWEKINVPSSWENQGFPGYNGYAWYRTSFILSSEFRKTDLYLILGYIDDVDQTYINGHLIGISGDYPPKYRTAYNALRKYFLPKEYLNYNGENVIAVRVYDAELDGGIISGKIGLYTNENGFQPDINLSGIWNFNTGDDTRWSEKSIVDTDWAKLMVPDYWDIQGYSDYDGFAWYRKTFSVPKDYDGESMILLLGQIDDIDQTFVNGILAGSTGMWNFKDKPSSFNDNEEYLQKRIYSIPYKLLNYGGLNTIAVRVYDGIGEGGIYEGPIGLITQSNYKKYFKDK
jgi:hypothetical protein